MKTKIPEKSIFSYFVLNFLTLGIYRIVFLNKLSKRANELCDGDGKKTISFVPVFFLSLITLGIINIVWDYKLAERFQENAERYGLRFSEGGAIHVVYDTVGALLLFIGPMIARGVMIKNYNKLAKAYNEYNGLVDPDEDKRIYFFTDNHDEVEA